MLLSFVYVKIQRIVCCRWIRAPADACFVQSVKHGKLDIRALMWKRTSNSYNISSFWICSIKVDKCLRTYYKLSWKYVNIWSCNVTTSTREPRTRAWISVNIWRQDGAICSKNRKNSPISWVRVHPKTYGLRSRLWPLNTCMAVCDTHVPSFVFQPGSCYFIIVHI